MKIKSKKTGLVQTVTKKEWESITKIGLGSRYDIIEKPKATIPDEVQEETKTKSKEEAKKENKEDKE